jgi:ABC-2 family transporter
MIWLTWRQFRTQAVTGLVLLIAVVAVYASTRSSLLDLAHDVGYQGCTADCDQLADTFLRAARQEYFGQLYLAGSLILFLTPAMVGLFWGAPLVARELETGTHRLVWNQTISRNRWLAAKLGVGALASALFAGLSSLALTAWASPIDKAETWITPLVFPVRGVVPIGYAVLAFVVGVTVGMLLRRVVAAMAVTLVVVLAAMIGISLGGQFLVPATTYTAALGTDWDGGISLSPDDPTHRIRLEVEEPVQHTWVLSNRIVHAGTDESYTGPYDPTACGMKATGGPESCKKFIASQNLQQKVTYISPDKFWALQWRELGVLLVASALLAIFCFWWIRRRVA